MTHGTQIPRAYWITKEGWPFIALGLAIGGLGLATTFAPATWLGFGFALFSIAFFRNPPRTIPDTPDAIVSPADGKVLAIEPVDEPFFGRGKRQRVTIFLSVANVHVNRTPFTGIIKDVKYKRGRYRLAYKPEASTQNECNALWVQGAQPDHELVMVQIAGTVARRIVCYVKPGDQAERGMRFGMIRFGSRMDLYLPLDCNLQIKVGDRVRGGSSLIGTFAKGSR